MPDGHTYISSLVPYSLPLNCLQCVYAWSRLGTEASVPCLLTFTVVTLLTLVLYRYHVAENSLSAMLVCCSRHSVLSTVSVLIGGPQPQRFGL